MKTRLPRVGPQGQMTGGQHCREGGQGLPGRPKVPLAQACKEEDFDLSGGDPHAPAMNKSDVQLWRMIFFNVYKFSETVGSGEKLGVSPGKVREGGPGQALPFLSRSCSCVSTCQHGWSSLCCLSGIFPLFRRLSQEQTWTHRAGGPWGLAGRDAPGCPHPPPLLRAWPALVPAHLGAQLVTPGQTPDSGCSKGPLCRTVGGHLGAGSLGSELQVM